MGDMGRSQRSCPPPPPPHPPPAALPALERVLVSEVGEDFTVLLWSLVQPQEDDVEFEVQFMNKSSKERGGGWGGQGGWWRWGWGVDGCEWGEVVGCEWAVNGGQ